MKTGSSASAGKGDGPVYLDASALAKVYLKEKDSDALESFLLGRVDLMVSDLGITEVVSAIARKTREACLTPANAHKVYAAIRKDFDEGTYLRLDMGGAVHRRAEHLLMSAPDNAPLRAADALHLALALEAGARTIVTYDGRLATAAVNIAHLDVHPAP